MHWVCRKCRGDTYGIDPETGLDVDCDECGGTGRSDHRDAEWDAIEDEHRREMRRDQMAQLKGEQHEKP